MEQLQQQVELLAKRAGGTWGITIEDFDKETVWSMNKEESFYAASVIKLPIMAATYAKAEWDKLALGEYMIIEREDIVGGAGVLQHMSPGTEISIYDLLMLMIIQSDNTATNMIIDLVGTDEIQRTIEELGMGNSSFYNKLMTVPVDPPGRNMITAADIALLLKKFVKGQYLSSYACEQMIEIMKKQQIRNGLSAYLPPISTNLIGVRPEWEVASKTGNVTGIQHDVGIFYVGNRTISVTVLSRDCDRLIALDTIANMGKSVYDYMKQS